MTRPADLDRTCLPPLTVRTEATGPDCWLVVAEDGPRPLGDELASLLRQPAAELRTAVEGVLTHPAGHPDAAGTLAPIDGRTELWAAGVTYQVSRSARMAESERSATVYDLIYDAERPELFLKSVAWRVRGSGQDVAIRADSSIDVPEPELAVLINAHGEIVGYSICNDLSSRSIEGENPLYLPQAKVFRGSAALGPGVVWAWDVPDPYALDIELTIHRDGTRIWSGTTSTSRLHRRLDDLAGWLYRELDFPDGAWLSTGTCLVPELPFTLVAGDRVDITIPPIGTLSNLVGE